MKFAALGLKAFLALAIASTALFALSTARADSSKNSPAPNPAAVATRSQFHFAVTQFGVADSISCPGWYDGWQDNLNSAVCDMLTTELVNDGWTMVEREKLKDITNEQDLGTSGRTDASTSPEIGKLLGADYLIIGTITEWGMKQQNVGGSLGGLFGNTYGDSAQYRATTATVKIDYRVVNSQTGVIEPGSAGTAMGENKTQGIAFTANWWTSVNLSEDDWTSTQIGKATRAAVQQIAQQLSGWAPTDGSSLHLRPAVTAAVVAVISPDEFVIDHGQTQGIQLGDTFDVFAVSPVKNAAGVVVYQNQTHIGTAKVTDVQSTGAKLDFTEHDPGAAKIKEGDSVKTLTPGGGG